MSKNTDKIPEGYTKEEWYNIYVNLNKKLNGQNSKHMIIWASFKLEIDAHNYADKLKKMNPTWDIKILRSFVFP
ncbi:MAG: hypothetical protein WC554_10320 [Clostridia bacterium]|jgi:hypothetical protein